MRMRLFLAGVAITLSTTGAAGQSVEPLKAAPDNPQACLTIVDHLQQQAEDRATTHKVDDQAMDRLGRLISTLEHQCQNMQFSEALATANDLVATINQIR